MRVAYYRVSAVDQSIEAQRGAMGGGFEREFDDSGVSGGVMAAERPAFARLLAQLRAGDELHVYAVDRLGRDTIDVLATARRLVDIGVSVHVRGLGVLDASPVGQLILAVLAAIAEFERTRNRERQATGYAAAKAALAVTGRTHKGALSLGRLPSHDAAEVAEWRRAEGASIAETARRFGISKATVKRYCQEPPRGSEGD